MRISRRFWSSGQGCACRAYHRPTSPIVGLPVNPETFDYVKAASFNHAAPRLATVTMQKVWRQMAAATGLTVKEVRCPTVAGDGVAASWIAPCPPARSR